MEIFVFGCGGHAKVVSDIIEAVGRWRIAGYVVADPVGSRFLGREVFEERRFLETRRGAEVAFAVGDNSARQKLYGLTEDGFSFPSIVHPSAVVSPSCAIGPGTVVMPGAIVNAEAEVGKLCVVNSGSVVEHECKLGDFVWVSPKACICGACRLDHGCYVGAGATVIQGMTVGRWSIVGAGAVVCAQVEESTVVLGVPARPRRRV